MKEDIPKAIVIEYPDGTKPKKPKWIFKSKTHFFATLGALAAFSPKIESFIVENPQATMIAVYILAAILRRVTDGKVYLFPKSNDLSEMVKKVKILAATFFIISCGKVQAIREDSKQLQKGLKHETPVFKAFKPFLLVAFSFFFSSCSLSFQREFDSTTLQEPNNIKESLTIDTTAPFKTIDKLMDFATPSNILSSIFEGFKTITEKSK